MDRIWKNSKLNRKGFTMLEVIAVVVVLGILMVVLMPRLTSGTDKAKELGVNKEFKDFSDSIETIFTENSRLPGTTDALFATKFNTYIDDYFAIGQPATVVPGVFETKAQDPFGAKYGLIISRDDGAVSGIEEKVLVYSGGKSLTTDRADFLTLAVYKDGKITKCNAGFKGDIQVITLGTGQKLGFSEDDTATVVGADGIWLPNTIADTNVPDYLTVAAVKNMTCVNK